MKKTLLGLLVLSGILQAQAIRGNGGFSTNGLKNDDDNFQQAAIGFTINFIGQTYQSTYISNNGNLTFGTTNNLGERANWVPTSLRSLSIPMIAPFYADVDTTNSANVTFGNDTVNGRRAFGVNYLGVGYYNAKADKLNSFQVVLIERADTGTGNFDIELNYGSIQWDLGDNTRVGRAYASVGYTNGLGGGQNSSFELPGSLTAGAFLDNGPFALIRQSRNSNNVPGRLVFEVRNGAVNNTTLVLQPDNTIRTCPEITLVARGSGFGGASTFTLPQFTRSLTENGQPREILEFNAIRVSDAPPGTYDFTVRYRSVPVITNTGTQTTSNVALTVTLSGAGDAPPYTASDTKTIRNCGLAADCGTLPKEGRVGFSLSGRAAASGGVPPYVFRAPNGVAPGLSLALDGALSGAPTAAGNFSYLLRVDDNSVSPVQFGTVTCAINVLGSNVPLAGTCNTPAGTAGTPYTGGIGASGGAGQYTFSITAGALPPGLTINASSGAITGTIGSSASGPYAFTATIKDASGATVAVPCSIQITGLVIPVPSISGFNPTASVVGAQPFRLTVNGTNFNSASVVVWNGFDLPTTFTSATSIAASITANLLGSAGTAKLRVRNGSTLSADADFDVFNPLTITSVSPANLRSTGTTTDVIVNGDGFFSDATATLNGNAAGAARLNGQSMRITVPASLLQQPGSIALRVSNPNGVSATATIPVQIAISVSPSVTVDKPAQVTSQTAAVVKLTQAPGQAIAGTLDITFVPSADNSPNNGANDFPRFTTASTRRVSFTMAADATEYRATIDQGTVAGTATVTLSSLTASGADILNGSRVTQMLTIDGTAPLIVAGSVGMVKTATGFNVEVTAISTQRNLTGASLTFTIASGTTNNGSSTFTVDTLPAAATAWFQSDRGKTEGGAFKVTIPYTLEGDFTALTNVAVTLTNSRGTSASVSGGRR